MVNILDRSRQLIFMTIGTATIFRAPIGEDPTQRDLLFLKERHYLIIESSSSRQSRFPIVEFGKRYLAIGINEGLLIDPAHPLQRADIKGILRATVTGCISKFWRRTAQ